MATITPTLITNRLGVTTTTPAATTNTGPTTGDIGADGSMPTRAHNMREFEITFTSSAQGDIFQLNKPVTLQQGVGCGITLTPMNAAAIAAKAYVNLETSSVFQITCDAAATGAKFKVNLNAFFSESR